MLPYFVISGSSEIRYLYWTILATAMATLMLLYSIITTYCGQARSGKI
jgi:hypothetical protein